MKKIIQLKLKILAKLILARYKPQVVGITGSLGKTSAKEAIGLVLSKNFRVRESIKNYNNEFGLPLTIIGSASAGHSLLGWFKIMFKVWCLLVFKDKNYPEILVLEMGIDKPGDMDYLNSIVKPRMAVLTMIGWSHLENFGTQAKLAAEKKKIFNKLHKGGMAIINFDDEKAREALAEIKHQAITYGILDGADIQATNLIYKFQEADAAEDLLGINFKIKYKDAYIPVLLPRAISHTAVSAALAGFAVGVAYDLNPVEIAQSLGDFVPPRGRMNLLSGINSSLVIDDTYNAAPQSTLAALEVADQMKLGRTNKKYIVLADMLELGEASEQGHLSVGERVAAMKKTQLLTMGQEALYIGIGAREHGLAEKDMQHFNNHQEIIDYLQDKINAGDLILVKGSQGMRMEKIVAGILAEPDKAGELLVRQGRDWK